MSEMNNNNIINSTLIGSDVFISGIFKLKAFSTNNNFVDEKTGKTIYWDSVKINSGDESYVVNCSAGSGVENLQVGKMYKFEFSLNKNKIKVVGIHEVKG